MKQGAKNKWKKYNLDSIKIFIYINAIFFCIGQCGVPNTSVFCFTLFFSLLVPFQLIHMVQHISMRYHGSVCPAQETYIHAFKVDDLWRACPRPRLHI